MRYNYPHASQELAVNTLAVTDDSSFSSEEFASLMPRIQSLALRTKQWVTVIGGSREAIQQLVNAGVSRSRIRWVAGRDADQREWATEQALLAGTSSVVLSFLGDVSSSRVAQRLKMARKVSQTHSFIFHNQPSRSPLH
ncbi:SOS-response cell division inhibitor [Pseudidiomarina sp. 1APP75-27a]|uniref:SOS-response cell division inhibitor n=1 Tax=Pseudidiomarina terrestris TaxID=2820060 RepID=UPI002B056D7D|nr:SOS-response cell division inhibitor [Pseudidiomarina sp. 1APP75-27a]MEA3588356.1 SOS-response cell division inhibitor [Pseudidiomarina sp. 1APP75-27a]